ncbi:MAG: cation transporter [Bacteroidetes bacterium]|nr:cation transporter [Bacteroidota bacterium]
MAHGHHDHAGHDHGHAHAHHHDGTHHHHGHHGAIGNLKVAFFLNLGFTILEIFGGIFTNSIAILSDALHDFGDSLALGMAWYLEKVAAKESDRSYSYGYARFSVLGAFINSVVLIVGAIFILQNAIPRLLNPQASDATGMIVFSLIGIAVNGAAVIRLQKGSTLNERVVALHLLEDVMGWVAILIGSIVMRFWDVPILDPILSIAIMTYVLVNVFRNLGKSFRIFLQGTPQQLVPAEIESKVRAVEGVVDVHDLHLWTLDGQYNVATLHVVVAGPIDLTAVEAIKVRVRHRLKELLIEHATIEIEDESVDCELGDCADHTHFGKPEEPKHLDFELESRSKPMPEEHFHPD